MAAVEESCMGKKTQKAKEADMLQQKKASDRRKRQAGRDDG